MTANFECHAMIKVTESNIKQVQGVIRAATDKRGFEYVVASSNACQGRGEMDIVFNLLVGEYRRYAALLADLVRIEKQMIDMISATATVDVVEVYTMNVKAGDVAIHPVSFINLVVVAFWQIIEDVFISYDDGMTETYLHNATVLIQDKKEESLTNSLITTLITPM